MNPLFDHLITGRTKEMRSRIRIGIRLRLRLRIRSGHPRN
jgi:hypothetical protein